MTDDEHDRKLVEFIERRHARKREEVRFHTALGTIGIVTLMMAAVLLPLLTLLALASSS